MTLNKMLVIGNVGTEPEMRYTPNGNPVTSFRMATNRRYTTSEGEQRDETEWFTVSAWNRLAETCNQYVTKGMKVYVEGRLKSDEWVGQDGQPRFRMEITANEVKFLDRGPSAEVPLDRGPSAEVTIASSPTNQESNGGDVENLPW